MKLKSVTLLAAITQLLAAIFSIIQWVHFAFRHGARWDFESIFDIAAWGVNDVAAVMLVVFLFALVARQKES